MTKCVIKPNFHELFFLINILKENKDENESNFI